MFYRENGQFKTSYRADQQIFPIRQDRVFIWLLLAVAFIAIPALSSDYLLRAILIPFLILSLAAVGLNILVGYCGQISLGTGAFMAVGAYAAWNFGVRFPGTRAPALAHFNFGMRPPSGGGPGRPRSPRGPAAGSSSPWRMARTRTACSSRATRRSRVNRRWARRSRFKRSTNAQSRRSRFRTPSASSGSEKSDPWPYSQRKRSSSAI